MAESSTDQGAFEQQVLERVKAYFLGPEARPTPLRFTGIELKGTYPDTVIEVRWRDRWTGEERSLDWSVWKGRPTPYGPEAAANILWENVHEE